MSEHTPTTSLLARHPKARYDAYCTGGHLIVSRPASVRDAYVRTEQDGREDGCGMGGCDRPWEGVVHVDTNEPKPRRRRRT